uniref:Uncharacterized protein n=1 Tax=Sphaerodactylus townsendi TaxID=933632 RepID=A0ACB8ESP1_9SAUR
MLMTGMCRAVATKSISSISPSGLWESEIYGDPLTTTVWQMLCKNEMGSLPRWRWGREGEEWEVAQPGLDGHHDLQGQVVGWSPWTRLGGSHRQQERLPGQQGRSRSRLSLPTRFLVSKCALLPVGRSLILHLLCHPEAFQSVVSGVCRTASGRLRLLLLLRRAFPPAGGHRRAPASSAGWGAVVAAQGCRCRPGSGTTVCRIRLRIWQGTPLPPCSGAFMKGEPKVAGRGASGSRLLLAGLSDVALRFVAWLR